MKKAFCIFLGAAVCGTLAGQTFERASVIADSDLRKALAELSTLRKRVETERIPLAKELSRLETDALKKRKEADRINRMRDNREVDLNTMQDRIKQLENGNSYLTGLLADYIRRFETQIHIGEQQIYQSKIDAAKLAVEDNTLSDDKRFEAQLEGLSTAFTRLQRVIGGHSFAGKAVLPGGSYEDGIFAIVGPIAYFSAKSGLSGLAELEINSANAVVKDIGEEYHEGIRKLTATKSSAVPIDATLGDALQLQLTEETPIEHIKKGGVVMYPILILASFAFLVAIFKWFEISGVKRARTSDLAAILADIKSDNRENAMAKANSVKSLGRALKRRSREVKTAVVKALGGTSGKALSLLTRELKGGTAKKNVTYMCDVVRSIGKIAEPKGVKTLTDLLRHKDNAVIGQAITALGDYSGKPTKTRKAIVKEILKYYEPTASAVSKSRPNATDKAKYDALYNPYEQTLAALTGQKEIQGAFKWGQWFRKEGSKKKEW